jgi:hypothetical protein
VEERNVFDRNLAALVRPINTAGSGGGQQGTDRWASAALFDPTDAGGPGACRGCRGRGAWGDGCEAGSGKQRLRGTCDAA